MKDNHLTYFVNRTNNLINYLIKGFTKNNLDEHSLIFLAKNTKRFMTTTQKAYLFVIFKLLDKLTFLNDKLFKDFIDVEAMISNIFETINTTLNDLLSQKIDKKRQEYIDIIVDNLLFVQKILLDIGDMAISILKFQTNIIDEKEFRNRYKNFKISLENEKNVFDQKYKKSG